jgi:hypothetical protein
VRPGEHFAGRFEFVGADVDSGKWRLQVRRHADAYLKIADSPQYRLVGAPFGALTIETAAHVTAV